MESSSGGSFIPKRSTGKVAPQRVAKRIYIFSYIAYALFFGTILSVVGIFLLNQQAEQKLASSIQQLAEARQAFNQNDMNRVIALSAQLRAAETMLDDHLAPSVLFDELEEVIVEDLQLFGLEYEKNNGTVVVSFTGSANTFDALMFQRTVMEDSAIFDASEISEVGYGNEVIEAVGDSARGSIDPLVTDTVLSFVISDNAARDKIGYTPRIAASSTPEFVTLPDDDQSATTSDSILQ